MSAVATLPKRPPRAGERLPASFGLSLAMHLLLFAALAFVVRWNVEPQGMVVAEACLIGLTGAIAGVVLSVVGGFAAAAVLKERIGLVVHPDLDPRSTMIVLAGAVILATLASVLPAIIAYRTPVADNLRPSA